MSLLNKRSSCLTFIENQISTSNEDDMKLANSFEFKLTKKGELSFSNFCPISYLSQNIDNQLL